MGWGFCPENTPDKFDLSKNLHLFVRKLCLKVLHHKETTPGRKSDPLAILSKCQCRELKDLLLSEWDPIDTPTVNAEELPDLIDLIDLEDYLDMEDPLKPELKGLKKKIRFLSSVLY